MNLSSIYKNKQTLLLLITLFGVLIFSIVSANYILGAFLFIVLVITIFIPSKSAHATSNLQMQMIKVIKNAAEGELEDRVTHIPKNDLKNQILLGQSMIY